MRIPCLFLTIVLAVAVFSRLEAAQLRVLAWDGAVAARKLAIVSGEKATPIQGMHPLKRTSVMKFNGPVAIRDMDGKPGADGKPVLLPVPIPEEIRFALLVLIPDTSNPVGVRALVVDDDPKGFAWGAYRFINATPKELVVQLEKTAKRIPPGWKPVDIDLGGEMRGVGVRAAISETIEKPLYSAVWAYDSQVRTLCFLVPGTDARTSPLEFKAIAEDRLELSLQLPKEKEAKH